MRLVLLADLRIETLLRGPLGDAGFDVEAVRTPEALGEACALPPAVAVALASLSTPQPPADFLRACRQGLGSGGPPLILILPAGSAVDVASLTEHGVADVCVAPFQGARLIRRIREIATGRKTAVPPVRPPPAAPNPFESPAALSLADMPAAPAPEPPPMRAAPEAKTPGPERRTPAPAPLSNLLEIDIELPSLPGKQIDLSGIAPINTGQARRDRAEATEKRNAEPAVALDAPPKSPDAECWPEGLPSIESCIGLLVAQTMGALLPEGTDEATLTATWKSLTTSDIAALKSIADRAPDLASTEDRSVALARLAATRLRLRTALAQGEKLLAAGARPRVNEQLIRDWKQQIDREVRESLDPILQRAIEEGDLARMKDFRTTREALSLRGQELDRLARRLWGTTQENVGTRKSEAVPLIRTAATPKAAGGATAIPTATPPKVRGRAPLLLALLAVVGVGAVLLYVFVFNPPRREPLPVRVDHSPPVVSIAGVVRIDRLGTTMRVVVNAAFNRDEGLRQLIRTAPSGVSISVENEKGIPVVSLSPPEIHDLAARIARGEVLHLSPPPGRPAAQPLH